MALTARKITQETFDEVVEENVEEFSLGIKEAISDAYNQFTTQGVDLTDIDISGGVGRQDMIDAIAVLAAHGSLSAVATSESSSSSTNLVLANIGILLVSCDVKHELFKRNLVMMRTNGGLDALHSLIFPSQRASILVDSLTLLELVSTSSGTRNCCDI